MTKHHKNMTHMKYLFDKIGITSILLAIFAVVLYGCTDDDLDVGIDTGATVNKTVEQMNANIRAFQKLLAAQAEELTVKSCVQLTTSTYQVELSDGNSFTVLTSITTLGDTEGPTTYYPVISAMKSNGTYYWTLDGEYLTLAGEKVEVIDGETPVVDIDAAGYWTVTYGGITQQLETAGEGTVKSLFAEIITADASQVKFSLRGDVHTITLLRSSSSGSTTIEPTGTLRRPITPDYPAWFIHIDCWNTADPQAIIDLIPDDIRPYVIFNIALSSSQDDDGNFAKVAYGYETAKSWLRTCAENNVWATVQGSSGGGCLWPDYSSYSQFKGSLFEEFFQDYPNFLGFVYAEQGWGFDGYNSSSDERLQHFAGLMQLSHEYGGYLVVSYFLPEWASNMSGVGMIKRNANLADACRNYPENYIPCEKFTQTTGFLDMESTSLGVFVSGFSQNYGIRYDQCGWYQDDGGWNGDYDYPMAAGALPIIEHITFTGQTVFDGPELIWQQCFKEGSTSSAGDGYTKRNWETYSQFDNIYQDIYRKILDGTIRILSRQEVIERTKVVVVNDISPTGASKWDPGYSAPANLFEGLYKMDEDGTQSDSHLFFKKTGRYPAIPTVAELADNLANSFEVQINASQFTSGTGWGNVQIKQNQFNTLFPEEFTADGMYVGRNENTWVAYNCYADTKTASIPFKYNTAEQMDLAFGKYSVAVIKEYASKVNFYLTNYTEGGSGVTDVIKISGSTSQPTYTYTNRVSGNSCTVSDDWTDGVLTLTVKHNGALDLTVNCSGTATDRETSYTEANIGIPASPDIYDGPRQYEAENFEYQNVSSVVKEAISTSGALLNYTALGYMNFGQSASAAVRDYVTVNNDGSYAVRIKYSAPSATIDTVDLYINGTLVASPEFTQTSSGDDPWEVVSVGVNLNEGSNKVELKANAAAAGSFYIDNMVVESL